jgi:hypothetical protein
MTGCCWLDDRVELLDRDRSRRARLSTSSAVPVGKRRVDPFDQSGGGVIAGVALESHQTRSRDGWAGVARPCRAAGFKCPQRSRDKRIGTGRGRSGRTGSLFDAGGRAGALGAVSSRRSPLIHANPVSSQVADHEIVWLRAAI